MKTIPAKLICVGKDDCRIYGRNNGNILSNKDSKLLLILLLL